MTLAELQSSIRATFGSKDSRPWIDGTFMWFMEEVGELAAALRGQMSHEHTAAEFADVLAWLATLANAAGVDLTEAMRAKYGGRLSRLRKVAVRLPSRKTVRSST